MWSSFRGAPQLKKLQTYRLITIERPFQSYLRFSTLKGIKFITNWSISQSCLFLLPDSHVSPVSECLVYPTTKEHSPTFLTFSVHSHLASHLLAPSLSQSLLENDLTSFRNSSLFNSRLSNSRFLRTLCITSLGRSEKERPVVCFRRWRLADKEV